MEFSSQCSDKHIQCLLYKILLQNALYYKTHFITKHTLLQNTLYYKTHFITKHTLLQNALYYKTYFSFQPVLHDWCNKGRGMYYPVCGMVHIKEPLLLIGKSSLCGGSGFPFSLSEWSLTICLTPYNHK